jgi:hypothetical protein
MRPIHRFSILALVALSLGFILLAQTNSADKRQALVLAVDGKAYYSVGTVKRAPLRPGLTLPEGSTLVSEKGATVDIYFRQIGSIFRMMPKTTLTLEALDKHLKNGKLVKETVVRLDRGRILTRARVLLPESRFEIKTPKAIFSVPEPGYGRYDIRADGTALVGRRSKVPLRVVDAKTSKTNLIAPRQIMLGIGGVITNAEDKAFAEISPQLDELQALADSLTPMPTPQELPDGEKYLPPPMNPLERAVVVLTSSGTVDVSSDGTSFSPLDPGQQIREGSIIRTGRKDSQVDLFFRRIGTIVRVGPESLVQIERLRAEVVKGVITKETLLNLKAGEVLCYVRVLVPESKFAIRTVYGEGQIAGSGTGRYLVRADGTFIASKKSQKGLNVSGNAQGASISPGNKFQARSGRVAPLRESEAERLYNQLDELQEMAVNLAWPVLTNDLPPGPSN